MGTEATTMTSMALSKSCLLGIFLFIVWAPVPSLQNHYCSISKEHTLCKFQGIGPRCKTPYEIGVPAADRNQIMHLHNSLRQMVANGNERRGRPGPQPSGANVLQMEWDEELAASAQRLADQCRYTHDCLNCRKVDRFLTGQNLYQFSENLLRDGANWEQAIMAWYDEVARFNPRSVDYFEFIKELGHYTQMLWAETHKMGCGYAYYKDGKWNRKLYICNYGPAGNVITTEMYKRGSPCSACPEGTFCSNQYPGLCTSGGSRGHSFVPQVSFVPEPTTRKTTTTRRPTTTTTTTTTTRRPTTTRGSPSKIIFNEIESNEIGGLDNNAIQQNDISTRLGFNNRFSGRPQQSQNQFNNNKRPSSSSFNRFSTQRNTELAIPFSAQNIRATTTTTRRPTTTRRATTTAVVTTKKPFTFSPRVQTTTNRRSQQQTIGNNANSQQQINENRISPLASGTIQVPQTQKNRFASQDVNRFATKSSFNRLTTSTGNNNNYHNGGGAGGSASGLNAQTEILRINDSPAYSVEDTNKIVLFCDFDFAKCPVRSNGEGWNYTTYMTPGYGKGFATVVEKGRDSNLEVRSVMYPSGDGTVCLYFRFVNFIFGSDGGPARTSGLGPDGRPLKFTVSVSPVKQSKKSVEISERSSSALDWLTAKVQFSGLHSMFLLIFEVPRNPLSDNVYLAIDDILVTKGICHT